MGLNNIMHLSAILIFLGETYFRRMKFEGFPETSIQIFVSSDIFMDLLPNIRNHFTINLKLKECLFGQYFYNLSGRYSYLNIIKAFNIIA